MLAMVFFCGSSASISFSVCLTSPRSSVRSTSLSFTLSAGPNSLPGSGPVGKSSFFENTDQCTRGTPW